MNVISIGTDRKIFEAGSAVRQRMIDYGAKIGSLHIIIFTRTMHCFKAQKISQTVSIYPTNSFSRLLYMSNALKIAKRVITVERMSRENTVVTTQDPFET